MTPHRLNDILHQVHSASQSEIELLEKLTKEFPYYNLPFIILAKIYKQKENYTYETSRTRASIRAANRAWLYDYLHENNTEFNENDDQGLELISVFVNDTSSTQHTEIDQLTDTKSHSEPKVDSNETTKSLPTPFQRNEDTSNFDAKEKTTSEETTPIANNEKTEAVKAPIEAFEALVDSFNQKFSDQHEEENNTKKTDTIQETQPNNTNEQYLEPLVSIDTKPIELKEDKVETTEPTEELQQASAPLPNVKTSFNDWLNLLGNPKAPEEIKPKHIENQQDASQKDTSPITETLTEKQESIPPPVISSEKVEISGIQPMVSESESETIENTSTTTIGQVEQKPEIESEEIESKIKQTEISAKLTVEEEKDVEITEVKPKNIDRAELPIVETGENPEIKQPKEAFQKSIANTKSAAKKNLKIEKEAPKSENQLLVSTNKSEVKQEEKKEKVIETLGVIDSFLNKNPTITRPKAEFFKAEVAARKSLELDNEIVTETLAKIYERQGYYTQAIQAYEKLSLKFPHKSTYFADLIKEIKTKNEN